MLTVVKYVLHWYRSSFEEFTSLRDALDSIEHYIDCCGGDDDERLPTLYAVLNNGESIRLQ